MFINKPKTCSLCSQGIKNIDYKDKEFLSKYLSVHSKIETRKRTNLCAKHQRKLAEAIKRARFLALIPYVTK